MKNLLIILFLVPLLNANAQQFGDPAFYLIDSLDFNTLAEGEKEFLDSSLTAFHNSKNDTVQALAALEMISQLSDINNMGKYAHWLEDYSHKKIKTNKGKAEIKYLKAVLAEAYYLIGYYEGNNGNYKKSIAQYQLCADIFKEINLPQDEAIILSNIGSIYDEMGDIQSCLDYYDRSLKIKKEIGDSVGLGSSYNNIGYIHAEQGNHEKAFEYHSKALEIRTLIGDKKGICNSRNNIGLYYSEKKEYRKALNYHLETLTLRFELNVSGDIANSYRNIAWNYWNLDEVDSALTNMNRALKFAELSQSDASISTTNSSIGAFYLQLGDYEKSLYHSEKAKAIAVDFENPDLIRRATKNLYQIYEHKKDFKKAFENYKLYIQMRDSLENKENYRITLKASAQYEYELKQAELEKEQAITNLAFEKELEVEKERKNKQKIITYFAVGGLVLVAVFLVFIFNRLKLTRRQKEEIDGQKQELEATHEQLAEHHKEISDSIIYAKRIQEAILPAMSSMNESLGDGFVLYIPKDVVAGDFYWMETVGDVVYFAAADCTGHGVPGAMVSVVCSNALSKSLIEEQKLDTGELLDKTRDLVIERFAKSGEEIKDGMDISLCALNKKTRQLNWSGANNPLWLIRNGECLETKADKQPIGNFGSAQPFQSHQFQLEADDILYIFTDGLQDQFGGEKGKKFKPKQIREILITNAHLSMTEQGQILSDRFHSWKGEMEQVDDICMIGVKI